MNLTIFIGDFSAASSMNSAGARTVSAKDNVIRNTSNFMVHDPSLAKAFDLLNPGNPLMLFTVGGSVLFARCLSGANERAFNDIGEAMVNRALTGKDPQTESLRIDVTRKDQIITERNNQITAMEQKEKDLTRQRDQAQQELRAVRELSGILDELMPA